MKRVGYFFMLIGGILLLLFFFSNQHSAFSTNYLLWGLGLFCLGILIAWKSPKKQQQDSDRFRLLKGGRKSKVSTTEDKDSNDNDEENDRKKRRY
jgi:hypothetical protein